MPVVALELGDPFRRSSDYERTGQKRQSSASKGWHQGGLVMAFDLAAFRLSMIAPLKKSVSHPRTVASMRVMGWE